MASIETRLAHATEFRRLPLEAQALYFHLCADANTEGHTARPKGITRLAKATYEDLALLVSDKFITIDDNGIATVWNEWNQPESEAERLGTTSNV